MSTLPLLLNLVNDFEGDIVPFYEKPLTRHFYVPPLRRQLSRLEKNHPAVSPIGKDGFQVSMDVTQFKPSELTVKVVDNSVVVEGKHEEREDQHGMISRHFVRRYALPEGYESDKVVSTLSSDGVLTIKVPKPQIEDKSNERIIQIQQTGPAHQNIKDNPKKNKHENDVQAKK